MLRNLACALLLQLGPSLQQQNKNKQVSSVIILHHCQGELKTATDSFLLLHSLVKTDTLSLLFQLLQPELQSFLSIDPFLLGVSKCHCLGGSWLLCIYSTGYSVDLETTLESVICSVIIF